MVNVRSISESSIFLSFLVDFVDIRFSVNNNDLSFYPVLSQVQSIKVLTEDERQQIPTRGVFITPQMVRKAAYSTLLR